jgi:hypothetical protein
MAWIGEVRNGTGSGPYNMFPTRTQIGNNVTNWLDPIVPPLDDCRTACGEKGFFAGHKGSLKTASRWDSLMLYLGKLRGMSGKEFWRGVLISDELFLAWIKNDAVRNSLSELLYTECIGTKVPSGNYINICQNVQDEINKSKATTAPGVIAKAFPLLLLCEFFSKADSDPKFIKQTIYRTLSAIADVDQCAKSEKQWKGNSTKCWLCNQNITNIYIGGAPSSNGLVDGTPIDDDKAATNKKMSDHSIHNKECEHCLPYIVGSYVLQLYGGDPKVKAAEAKAAAVASGNFTNVTVDQAVQNMINAALSWQNLEYEWSHSYCNQIKSQGHFLEYNEETGEFEVDYLQIANFSKRLRCQGNYKDSEYKNKETVCSQQVKSAKPKPGQVGQKTLREQNWKTFTDETDELQYRDASGTLAPNFIRTSCDPNASGKERSCRMSFITDSDIPDINDSDSPANKYLAASKIKHRWMKDTDAIILKMIAIVDKLNKKVDSESGMTIGLLSLIRARISSFVISKYLEDVSRELAKAQQAQQAQQNPGTFIPITDIWSTNLPEPWNDNIGFKYSPNGDDTPNIVVKFVLGVTRCCEASIRANARDPTFKEMGNWLDGCIHGTNAAYLSLEKVATLKGETLFGRPITRAYEKATILMASPYFVRKLLEELKEGISEIPSPFIFSDPTGDGAHAEYRLNTVDPSVIIQYGQEIKKTFNPRFISENMKNEAEEVIPGITKSESKADGSVFNSQWESVSRIISNNFETFIIHLNYYSTPVVSIPLDMLQIIGSRSNPQVDENKKPLWYTVAASTEADKYLQSFDTSPAPIQWLENPDVLEFMLYSDKNVLNVFWEKFSSLQARFIAVKNSGRFTDDRDVINYIAHYMDEYVSDKSILDKFLANIGASVSILNLPQPRIDALLPQFINPVTGQEVDIDTGEPIVRRSGRTRRRPDFFNPDTGRFGKITNRQRAKPKGKPRAKPKGKPKSKSSDTNLKNKLKMVGIKVTKMVKGKRVSLTKKELQKRISAFKKLQTKAKKLKVSLKYKSTSGRYKFKSRGRLIFDIKKARKKKNTKRKNTKRKNTKRKNTKRKNTKRKN